MERVSIMGLDVGQHTGVCRVILDSGKVHSALFAEVSYGGRADEFYDFNIARTIEGAIKDYQPDYVFFEGYAFGGRGFFNVHQSEITAQVKRFLVDGKIKFCELNVSNMRLVVMGKGNAKKSEARAKSNEYFSAVGFPIPKTKAPHIYDACIPAIYGIKYLTGELSPENHRRIEESIVGG